MTECEITRFLADVICYVAGKAYPPCEDQSFEANRLNKETSQ